MWTGLIDHGTLYKALRLSAVRYDKGTGKTLDQSEGVGHGTGFVVRAVLDEGRRRSQFLVTNRHVMDPAFRYGGPPRGQDELTVSGYYQANPGRGRYSNPQAIKVSVPHPEVYFPKDPDVDLAVVRFDRDVMEVDTGGGQFNAFTVEDIASPWVYAEGVVYAGKELLLAGYPSLIGDSELSRPVFVGGIVASDPRFSAEASTGTLNRSVLSHSFSQAGMSGAPVLSPVSEESMFKDGSEARFDLRIIGVNAGHVQTSDFSGVVSHFVNSNALLELLAELGVDRAKFKLELESIWSSGRSGDMRERSSE